MVFIILCTTLKNEYNYYKLSGMVLPKELIDQWLADGDSTYYLIITASIVPLVKLVFRILYNYLTMKLYLKSNKLNAVKIIELDFFDYEGCIYFQQKFANSS
jgi:hypothetical protein